MAKRAATAANSNQKNKIKEIVAPTTTKATTPSTSTSYQPLTGNIQTSSPQPTQSLIDAVTNTNTVGKGVNPNPTKNVSPVTSVSKAVNPTPTKNVIPDTPISKVTTPSTVSTPNAVTATSVGTVIPAIVSSPQAVENLTNVATGVTPNVGLGNTLSGSTLGVTPSVGVGNTLAGGMLGASGANVLSGNASLEDVLSGAYGGGINTPIPAYAGSIIGMARNNNNVARRNIRLNDAMSQAARNALVNSGEEIDETVPYTEVPGVGSLYASLINPGQPASVMRTDRLPDENKYISNAMEESVRRTLNDLGIPGTYSNNVFDQILNPSTNPLNEAIRSMVSTGNTSINTSSNNSTRGGLGSGGGRNTASRGASGTNGLNGTDGYVGDYDYSDLYDLLNARLNEYDNNYNSLIDSLMEMYGLNSSNLEDSYAQLLNALGLNYADTEGLLRSQYENSQSELENSRRRQLQEAYIARMMQQKNLGDQLDALGLTGGASETILANLLNNYNNNRASVEEQIRASLRDILNNYMTNQTSARQRYNDALIDAQQRQLNARQSLMNNLYNAQADALTNRARYRDNAYEDLFNAVAKNMR